MSKIGVVLLLLLATPLYAAHVVLSSDFDSIPIYSRPDVKSKIIYHHRPGLMLKPIDMNRETGLVFYKVPIYGNKYGWVCETHLLTLGHEFDTRAIPSP
jgi:hypothetical protein